MCAAAVPRKRDPHIRAPENDRQIVDQHSPDVSGEPGDVEIPLLGVARRGGMSNVSMDNLAIYYPELDNSQATPTVFPPTFEDSTILNDSFGRLRVLNSYDLFKVDPGGSGWGRVFIDNTLTYCVDKCFWWLNGAPDTIQLGPSNYFGQGAFGSTPNSGPAYLSRYTEASGALAVIDVSGGAYKSVDGFIFTGGLVQGYRYGIRVLSGLMDVSNFANVNWDQVGSVLSVEGTGQVITTAFTGGEFYSINVWNPAQSLPVFNFAASSANPSSISISGVHSSYSQGSFIGEPAAA